jgi:hypothetical protein
MIENHRLCRGFRQENLSVRTAVATIMSLALLSRYLALPQVNYRKCTWGLTVHVLLGNCQNFYNHIVLLEAQTEKIKYDKLRLS